MWRVDQPFARRLDAPARSHHFRRMRKIAVSIMLVAAGLLGGAGLASAQSAGVGAPTSAAGGVNPSPLVPANPSLPSSAGPIGSPGPDSSDHPSVHALTPGTGKFEAPNNAPCIGATGFGSSDAQPGHRC
jgi:hypothetical protein